MKSSSKPASLSESLSGSLTAIGGNSEWNLFIDGSPREPLVDEPVICRAAGCLPVPTLAKAESKSLLVVAVRLGWPYRLSSSFSLGKGVGSGNAPGMSRPKDLKKSGLLSCCGPLDCWLVMLATGDALAFRSKREAPVLWLVSVLIGSGLSKAEGEDDVALVGVSFPA